MNVVPHCVDSLEDRQGPNGEEGLCVSSSPRPSWSPGVCAGPSLCFVYATVFCMDPNGVKGMLGRVPWNLL